MRIAQFYPVKTDFDDLNIFIKNIEAGYFPSESFSEEKVEFLSELSKKILAHSESKKYPELIAFAFWIRKSNINSFLQNLNKENVYVPRGIAFHITPSNVDIMFLYSWALSLLAGNVNVVRISQSKSALVDLVIDLLTEHSKDTKWQAITESNLLVSYPHDDDINAALSSISDLRIIWGGDETVNKIRSFASPAFSKDVSFSDKRSCSVIDSSSYLNLDSAAKDNLAHLFYNDAYWFNQMACSSPLIVYFSGSEIDCENAGEIFWETLSREIKRNNYSNQLSVKVDHMVTWFRSAAGQVQKKFHFENGEYPVAIKLEKENLKSELKQCGGGFFYEVHVKNINELSSINFPNDQTLTYFGFDKEELKALAKTKSRFSFCRFVPIGQGLNFEFIWDGYNLLNEFSKVVKVI